MAPYVAVDALILMITEIIGMSGDENSGPYSDCQGDCTLLIQSYLTLGLMRIVR